MIEARKALLIIVFGLMLGYAIGQVVISPELGTAKKDLTKTEMDRKLEARGNPKDYNIISASTTGGIIYDENGSEQFEAKPVENAVAIRALRQQAEDMNATINSLEARITALEKVVVK